LSDVTANIGSGSSLTAALKVGTDSANLGSGSGLTANLKETGAETGYSTEYQAVYDSLTTPPSKAIATAQDTMVTALVTAGVWTKLDLFYLFAQSTNGDGEALVNWVNPGTYDATAYNSPTFTALEGFTGANTKYIDCNWNPNSDGVNFTLNDASVGVYSRTDVDEAKSSFGIIDGSNGTLISIRNSGHTYNRLNTTIAGDYVDSNSLGLYILNRTASNVNDMYKNGSLVTDDTDASSSVPNYNMYVLARNNGGVSERWVTKQISMFFAGGGLTTDDITNFTNAFETYMDSNSKGVIS